MGSLYRPPDGAAPVDELLTMMDSAELSRRVFALERRSEDAELQAKLALDRATWAVWLAFGSVLFTTLAVVLT